MIDIHQNGWTKSIFDKDQRELLQKTMFFTFEDRFNALVDLLSVRAPLISVFHLG